MKNKGARLMPIVMAVIMSLMLVLTACGGKPAVKSGKLTVQDMTLVNTSDSDIGPAFITNRSQEAVVTWNPMVLDILTQVPGVTNAFNSSSIPYEILDIMFVNTKVLNEHPELAKALVGAWYETMAVMTGRGPEAEKALQAMAEESGTTLDSYQKQLDTTYMYWRPGDAANFTRSKKLLEVMDLVRRFSYDHGLWTDAKSVDAVGIEFPGGTVLGDPANTQLRFTDEYMQLAADGKLTPATPTGPKQKFTVMWSIYVGWMPWPYAQQSGILKKWADLYNIEVDLKRADYVPSIEAYVAGKADAVVMTNMEALNMAAAAGIDSTAVIVGDYSNGNDALLTRNSLGIGDLWGKKVYIVELSVSQYLLERGLELWNSRKSGK